MGMSSSQARLLSLTARMHDIEYKAQRLEAQKLQLANESSRAYEDYLRVLDAKKLQYKTILNDGTITFRDATPNILQNGVIPNYSGEKARDILFLQNQNGKVMITEAVANHYKLNATTVDPDLDHYIPTVVPGATKTKPVYNNPPIDDEDNIVSFTKIATSSTLPNRTHPTTWTPVPNLPGALAISYTGFQKPVTTIDTSSIQNIKDVSSLSSGSTYVVNDADGLYKLQNLSASSTSGVKIILDSTAADRSIDMSGYNWSGIQNFAGTFEGNGVIIKNLGQDGGTATQGLFRQVTSSGIVRNVGLENVNVDGTGNDIAGIAGTLYGTVDNCYITGSIKTKQTGSYDNGYHIGAIVGDNESGTVSYTNADITVIGYGCTGGISGHNSGTLSHCNVTGTVMGGYGKSSNDYTNWLGGICGHNNGTTTIVDCNTSALVTYYYDGIHPWETNNRGSLGGIVIGEKDSTGSLTISNVTFDPTINGSMAITNSGDFGTTGTFKTPIVSPSVTSSYTGEFYNNVFAALIKSGIEFEDIDKAKVKTYVQKLYGTTDADKIKLANVNEYLYNYLTGTGTTSSAFINDLIDDINSGSTAKTTSAYQDVYDSTYYITVNNTPAADVDDIWSLNKGVVTIPSKDNIGEMLYYALKQKYGATMTKTETEVKSWLNTTFPTTNSHPDSLSDTDPEHVARQNLANINNVINNGDSAELDKIYSAITGGPAYSNTTEYPTDKYKVVFSVGTTISHTFGKKPNPTPSGYEWDTSIPEIAKAIAMWYLGQKGIEIIHEPEASNYEYLENMLEGGEVVLTEFDPNGAVALQGMPAADIIALPEEKFNEIMKIKNTSVSIRTSVREVQDEKELRKAEAKYEADMKKIDLKDRRYDSELAAVDTERNAIKQEMDTLKNVAKDNCERTFKLFS